MNKSLVWKKCHIISNVEEDRFVGLKMDHNDIKIFFPLGYHFEKLDDAVIRREILSLFSILQKFCKQKNSEKASYDNQNQNLNFPIFSYQYLIMNYLKNGYYIEKEITYENTTTGKVNWKKTIQKNKAYIANNSAVYLNFMVRKNTANTNALLVQIHKFCVYESFLKLGWLYTEYEPLKPNIIFNKSLFLNILKTTLHQTFNDEKKKLLCSMINIINHVKESSVDAKQFSFGTSSFEYAWENMIDYVFGVDDKKKYFPKTEWRLLHPIKTVPSSLLKPDTIIKIDNKIYIIDAKYYKYGITRNEDHLPASSSIQKQITYGEYLENKKSEKKTNRNTPYDNIYNAFIMPFKSENKLKYEFFGIATADWKNDINSHEKVLGILLDTKHLMNSVYKQNSKEIEKLTKLIEKAYSDDSDS